MIRFGVSMLSQNSVAVFQSSVLEVEKQQPQAGEGRLQWLPVKPLQPVKPPAETAQTGKGKFGRLQINYTMPSLALGSCLDIVPFIFKSQMSLSGNRNMYCILLHLTDCLLYPPGLRVPCFALIGNLQILQLSSESIVSGHANKIYYYQGRVKEKHFPTPPVDSGGFHCKNCADCYNIASLLDSISLSFHWRFKSTELESRVLKSLQWTKLQVEMEDNIKYLSSRKYLSVSFFFCFLPA